MLKFLLNNYDVHQQQHFETHATVEDFTDMDQDTCLFFHQDFSKHHETKINGGALKIITCQKIRSRTSKNIAPKQMMFHQLLYASFSLKLSQHLLTYWIAFGQLHFYLLIFDILRMFDTLQSSPIKPVKFSVSKCSYFPSKHSCLLTATMTPDVDNFLLLVHGVQELHSSLDVTRNFWSLIIASTKWK